MEIIRPTCPHSHRTNVTSLALSDPAAAASALRDGAVAEFCRSFDEYWMMDFDTMNLECDDPEVELMTRVWKLADMPKFVARAKELGLDTHDLRCAAYYQASHGYEDIAKRIVSEFDLGDGVAEVVQICIDTVNRQHHPDCKRGRYIIAPDCCSLVGKCQAAGKCVIVLPDDVDEYISTIEVQDFREE